jgi:hypothetical protein
MNSLFWWGEIHSWDLKAISAEMLPTNATCRKSVTDVRVNVLWTFSRRTATSARSIKATASTASVLPWTANADWFGVTVIITREEISKIFGKFIFFFITKINTRWTFGRSQMFRAVQFARINQRSLRFGCPQQLHSLRCGARHVRLPSMPNGNSLSHRRRNGSNVFQDFGFHGWTWIRVQVNFSKIVAFINLFNSLDYATLAIGC